MPHQILLGRAPRSAQETGRMMLECLQDGADDHDADHELLQARRLSHFPRSKPDLSETDLSQNVPILEPNSEPESDHDRTP